MNLPSLELHKIWMEQCAAAENIRHRFGLENALDYLIGEKLFSFVTASEQHPDFAAELPAFVAEIRRLFTAAQIPGAHQVPRPTRARPGNGRRRSRRRTLAGKSHSGRRGIVAFPPYPATPSAIGTAASTATGKPWRNLSETPFERTESRTKPSSTPMDRRNRPWAGITTWKTD